jgi:putative hydrolase of the HAD superfamily
MRRSGGRPPIRAVFFDAVATLILPHPSVGAVYARAAAAHGLRCPPRALETQFSPAYRELFPRRFSGPSRLRTSEARERGWWRLVVARTFERAGFPGPPAAVLDAAVEAFSRGAAWRLRAGALPTLTELRRRGVRVALVSNYDSRLRRVVRELGVARCFTALVISAEVGWAKPSPHIFAAALARTGVRPEEALMVGDRRLEDYEGGRAAGLHALRLDPHREERGAHVIRRLTQVLARVDRAG